MVAVRVGNGVARVEVTTAAVRGPQLRASDGNAENGRVLDWVPGLAVRWVWRRRGGRTVNWFELRHG